MPEDEIGPERDAEMAAAIDEEVERYEAFGDDEDEIDERLSDPEAEVDDEPYHEEYEGGTTDTFTDAQGQRYIYGQPVTEEAWVEYERLVAEEAEIKASIQRGVEQANAGDLIDLGSFVDEPVDAVALHSDAAANIAAARDVPGDYTGEVVYLYDYRDNGNLRVVDGPFRADVPFGLEIDEDQTLGPLPVTLPRED